ncbi:MAG: Smr/MutS family protein [Bilophila wadsworthia]
MSKTKTTIHPEIAGKNAASSTRKRNEIYRGHQFLAAMQDVTPLSGKGREVAAEAPVSIPPVQTPPNPLQEFIDGKLEFALAFTDEYVEGHVVGLDLMLVGKLQAGQFSPESHLDLHGMNAQQAFDALVGFFRAAYFKGQRTVLVVPGRGLNSPHGISILRESSGVVYPRTAKRCSCVLYGQTPMAEREPYVLSVNSERRRENLLGTQACRPDLI